jgi:hypothetical protein
MQSRRDPSTDLEGTRSGILDPTPIRYLGADHTEEIPHPSVDKYRAGGEGGRQLDDTFCPLQLL